MTMNNKGKSLALAFVLSLISIGATAGQILVNPSQTGAISQTETFGQNVPVPYFSSSNPLEDFNYSPPYPIGEARSLRNEQGYLLFDLSALSGTAESARIEFDLGYTQSRNPGLAVTSLDLVQAQSLSSIPAGSELWSPLDLFYGTPEEQAAFNRLWNGYNAISNGAVLGALTTSGPLDGLYSIDLNSDALNLINGGSGLFGVGLTWNPSGEMGFISGLGYYEQGDKLSFNATPTLVLNTVSAVPLPAAAWLFLSAIGGLGFFKRRIVT